MKSMISNHKSTAAFTLVELLVVITIIVILLALLTPALDQAIYQAELAVCAAKQDALTAATFSYTMGHRRFYPHRKLVEEFGRVQPHQLHRNPNASDIKVLQSFLSLNDNLQDPLVKAVDLTIITGTGNSNTNDLLSGQVPQHTWIYSSYAYWAGWRYSQPAGLKGMRKLGDGMKWDEQTFRMIASDHDMVAITQTNVQSKHPDAGGVMYNQVLQNELAFDYYSTVRLTYSTWTAELGVWRRGPIDMNIAFDDGSVRRYNSVPADARNHEQMTRIPEYNDAFGWNAGSGWGNSVPRAGQ
jgi:prepilin-type N-terminal cleavage/methylation domain-containing protein